jgi:hypothetical protein
MFTSRFFRRAAAVAGALLVATSASVASAELLSSCGFSAGNTINGDGISRGFYITNYAGQSLRSIKLRHSGSVAGTYQITVTARATSYAGTVIGEPYTATVALGAVNGTDVTYQLGDMPVAPGSTVTFSMTSTGPGSVFYDVGVPAACPNVTETEGTTSPLSSFRRDRVGYEVYGRAVTQTFYNCAFGTGGDLYDRGIYITSYPGETLRKVSIRYETITSGARQVRLTARQTGFNGSIIGTPQVKTLNMVGGSANGQVIDWDFGGAFVKRLGTITFTHEVLSGDTGLYHSPTTGACANVVETEGTTGVLDTTRGTRGIRVTGDREAGYRQVVEYFIPALNHYFISGRPNEQALLDQYPAVYQRTGATFLGFPSIDAPQGSVPVCRFYLPPGLGGPNSHFYGQPTDCTAIIATGNPVFQFEGYDFALYTPSGSTCPSFAPNKVYRSFNNRTAFNDGNHRYTTTVGNYNAMTALGWAAEGAVFCSDITAP